VETNYHQTVLRTQTIFLLVLSIAIPAVFALVYLLNLFPQNTIVNVDLFIKEFRVGSIFPEPVERNTFLILVFTLPILALFLARHQEYFDKWTSLKIFSVAIPFLVAFLLFLPLYNSDFLQLIIFSRKFFIQKQSTILLFSLGLATLFCLRIRNQPPTHPSTRVNAITWTIFIVAMLIQLLSWRIASINSVSNAGEWIVHADAAVYSLSQVVAGKTLLVDLPSQYGLYPELIAPIFKLIGSTVLNVTLFFASLQIISLLGLFFVLTKLVKNPTVLTLGGISLLLVTFDTVIHFTGWHDRYFQYWPIRFFWPALSVLVFYYFCCNKTIGRASVVSLVSAIGLFWNTDTGLFIFLSFPAFLIAQFVVLAFKKDKTDTLDAKKYPTIIGLHVIITGVVIGFLLGMMWYKAQQPLHLEWQFAYQKLFYSMGFAMLPIPREIHPWMSVLGLYLLGIILTLTVWFKRSEESIRAEVILYLCLLGVGIFVYYQGRSHVNNLINVCWPAILVLTITADSVLKGVQERRLPLSQIALPIAAMSFLLICSIKFMAQMPRMTRDMIHQFSTRHSNNCASVPDELAFIKKHTQSKRACLILSQRQGIYHLETGLASPIKGPGLVEILLKSDQDYVLSQIMQGNVDCIFLGIGFSSPLYIHLDLKELSKLYDTVGENSWHTMRYLTRKA